MPYKSMDKPTSPLNSALISIGFSEKEAFDAVRALGERGKTTEEKIKLALKYLGK